MPSKIREIRIEGNVAYVPLTKGYEAVIDAEDVPLVDRGPWCVAQSGRKPGQKPKAYAQRQEGGRVNRQRILMHRLILNAPDDMQVDHINGNTMDNRRCNLRLATPRQNQQNRGMSPLNTSGIKGVRFDARRGKWFARIRVDGRATFLGYHVTKEGAAEAYASACLAFHAAFARPS